MPRIYNSASEPHDFCMKCFVDEDKAEKLYNQPDEIGLRDGEDNGYGYDSAHPNYENEGYPCDECGELLTYEDN